jgi:hypothetical protein
MDNEEILRLYNKFTNSNLKIEDIKIVYNNFNTVQEHLEYINKEFEQDELEADEDIKNGRLTKEMEPNEVMDYLNSLKKVINNGSKET